MGGAVTTGWLKRSLEEAAAEASQLPKWALKLEVAMETGSAIDPQVKQAGSGKINGNNTSAPNTSIVPR
jgi:hypothetical protein